MNIRLALGTLSASLALASTAFAVSTGSPFYGDPPDDRHPWAVHDQNRPQPKRVAPLPVSELQKSAQPPADAVVLFDGTEASLSKWEADKDGHEPTQWLVRNGAMECVPKSGYVRTKAQLGDGHYHVEWAAPTPPQGESQGRGNSGIFLLGLVEIQVLDNYDNPTYADGFACSYYGVCPPLANALRPPGEFQYVDITFHRPVYADGKCVDPGYVTVFCNGVLVQDRTQIEGPTGHMRRTKMGPLPEQGPLKLQDHGNPVRFRNLWYRPLPPQPAPGGVNGPLTAEAAAAKRKELAATIRADAATQANSGNPLPEALRLMESLVYENDAASAQKVERMFGAYVASLKQLPADQLAGKKDEAKRIAGHFKYMTNFKLLPDSFAPKLALDDLIKQAGWDKKK